MTLTHILVDFENVQPSATDIGLVRGDSLRLCIFRGPGQMKYQAEVAEAWQPLGENVSFIRCAKAGRNAVDMHIAFYLGELIAAQGGGKEVRFVVVSRDTDFDPLLMHIRSQGFEATRAASIKAALDGSGAERAEPRAAKSRGAPAAKAAKAAAGKAPAAKKAAAKKAPAVKKPSALLAPATTKAEAPANRSTAAAPDAIAKVIASLQRMGVKRPAKRKGLERHIESHLGRKMDPSLLPALMDQLERDGVLVFNDNKVEYRLPKAKK